MRVVLLVLCSVQALSPQTGGSLTSLTPPPERLGGACQVAPRPSEQTGERIFRSGLWGPVTIPTNPWFGDDPAKVAAIGEIVMGFEGAPRLPDGPPMDRQQAQAARYQATEGAKGYAAAYKNGTEPVLVYALQSSRLKEGAHGLDEGAGLSNSTGLFRTAGLWVRLVGRRGECFDALRHHVEQALAADSRPK